MQIYDPSIHHDLPAGWSLTVRQISADRPTHSARLVVFPRRTSVYFRVGVFEGSFDRSVTSNLQLFQSSSAHLLSICRDSANEMLTPLTHEYSNWMIASDPSRIGFSSPTFIGEIMSPLRSALDCVK